MNDPAPNQTPQAVLSLFASSKPSWQTNPERLVPAQPAPFVRRMGEERREVRVWPIGDMGSAVSGQSGGVSGVEVDVITELRLQSGELQGKMVTIIALAVTDADNWVKLLDTTPSDPQPCP
jgi:hypothetical protein